MITVAEAAENRLFVTVYPVADLVDWYRDEKGAVWADFEPLADTIHTKVKTQSVG